VRTRSTSAALAVLLLASACSGQADNRSQGTGTPQPNERAAASEQFYAQEIRWSDCGGEFECATLKVPLDYDAPEAETIDLAILRAPATNPEERIGSLFVNPGGPGVSGVEHARAARAIASDAVRERYDIVGFDPRGVGQSTPVDCLDDAELNTLLAADASPDTPEEVTRLDELSTDFGAGCEDRSGRLLPHIGTANVARDLDVLRAVLGDDTLHYLGASYGTAIGAAYARQFPEHVGRMVLDGAIDPTLDGVQLSLNQANGFQGAFDRFLDACVASSCPLGHTKAAAAARFDQLMADIDAKPLPTQDGRELTEALAVLGVAFPLYLEPSQGYPALQLALARATGGDGTPLMTIADLYLDRSEDGRFKSNRNEAIVAVNCLDEEHPSSLDEIEQLQPQFVAASPSFGRFFTWSLLTCARWPVPAMPSDSPVTAAGAPPILVVGTTGDPATPYEEAVALAEQLESGVLLTVEGSQHTAYRSADSQCVDGAVDAYLLDGTVPAEGTRCT
jgi:pimeloyl-ACP methyl ester carboxylesterase